VFAVTPLSSTLGLLRLAHAAMRGAHAPFDPGGEAPPPRGFLGRLADAGRALFGGSNRALGSAASGRDLTVQLRLTTIEARRGGPKRLTVEREDGRDELLVTIPSGVRSGTKLRLRGKGRRTRQGPPGDLYLAVEVAD